MINNKNKKEEVTIKLLNCFKKSLFGGVDTLDCKFSPRLFDIYPLEIAEPVCERIFEQTKH